MGELKRRRQALTAAVYGEARVEGFDGEVLRLVYPEEQGFHVGMARDKGHTEKLTAVLEERLGTVPRLEIRASVGETSDTTAATAEESPPPASPTGQPAPEPAVEESATEARSKNGSGGTAVSSSGPGAVGNDDLIRNQREVFEIAREISDKN
jgi:DNA polymerase III subunit gamma/tau